jgi:hypothetical protein
LEHCLELDFFLLGVKKPEFGKVVVGIFLQTELYPMLFTEFAQFIGKYPLGQISRNNGVNH